jgi:dimethylsulfoniopropionate demethylase
VGQVTSSAKSPDYKTNVAIGMVRMTHWDEDTSLKVVTQDGTFDATVHENFWH